MLKADVYLQDYLAVTNSMISSADDLIKAATDFYELDSALHLLRNAREVECLPEDLLMVDDKDVLLESQRQQRTCMSVSFFAVASVYALLSHTDKAISICREAAFENGPVMTNNDMNVYWFALKIINANPVETPVVKLDRVVDLASDFFVNGSLAERRQWVQTLLHPDNENVFTADNELLRNHGRWKGPEAMLFLFDYFTEPFKIYSPHRPASRLKPNTPDNNPKP